MNKKKEADGRWGLLKRYSNIEDSEKEKERNDVLLGEIASNIDDMDDILKSEHLLDATMTLACVGIPTENPSKRWFCNGINGYIALLMLLKRLNTSSVGLTGATWSRLMEGMVVFKEYDKKEQEVSYVLSKRGKEIYPHLRSETFYLKEHDYYRGYPQFPNCEEEEMPFEQLSFDFTETA